MDYSKMGAEEYHRLKEYAETRFSELSKIFQDEIRVLTEYEELICLVTIILGSYPPRDITDRSIRDLLADVFDFLYISRRLILEGYASTAFPLLRRAFESISLIHYFMLLPNKAIVWDKGKQLSNAEIRKYLNSHPMGESEKAMKDLYAFFSGATHPNREYIPTRFLGEKNQFVLGAIGLPNLLVLADYIHRLIELWFWFGALISYYYRDLLSSVDKNYGDNYMKIANEAKRVSEELLKSQRELWEKERGREAKPASDTACMLRACALALRNTSLSANTVYAGKVMRPCGVNG